MQVGKSVGEGQLGAGEPLASLSSARINADSGARGGNAVFGGDMACEVSVLPCPSANESEARAVASEWRIHVWKGTTSKKVLARSIEIKVCAK